MKKRVTSVKLSKVINSVFNSKTFLTDLANLCDNNYNAIIFALGDILEYYITSRDERFLTVEELNVAIGVFKYVGNNRNYEIKNVYKNETPDQAIKRNVISDGFMSKSTNAAFLKKIKKYGLGSEKSIDDKMNNAMDFLESIFGKSDYKKEEFLHNQFCMTTPGVNSFYHASSSCPKRFFIGILGQKYNQVMPIKCGETKIQYCTRIFDIKINDKQLEPSLKKRAYHAFEFLIKLFCKDRPKILLIPIYSDVYDMKVTKKRNDDYDLMPIKDWIILSQESSNPMEFFSRDIGNANGEHGNIIAYETIIPYNELCIIDGFDRFEIMQAIARNKGYAPGTLIDYTTGEEFSVTSSSEKEVEKVPYIDTDDEVIEMEKIERVDINKNN